VFSGISGEIFCPEILQAFWCSVPDPTNLPIADVTLRCDCYREDGILNLAGVSCFPDVALIVPGVSLHIEGVGNTIDFD